MVDLLVPSPPDQADRISYNSVAGSLRSWQPPGDLLVRDEQLPSWAIVIGDFY